MTVKQQINKMIIPLDIKDIKKWCKYFYKNVPEVRAFVDYLNIKSGKKVEVDWLIEVLWPHIKLLAYQERLKGGN